MPPEQHLHIGAFQGGTINLVNSDQSTSTNQKVGVLTFGVGDEDDFSNEYYPIGQIGVESHSAVTASTTAHGNLFYDANLDTTWVRMWETTPHDSSTNFRKLRIGDFSAGFATIDSAKVVADTLKFYSGGNAYNAILGD